MNEASYRLMFRSSRLARDAWKTAPAWSWIVAVGVLTHGIVLLTDYVLWDGWWYAADMARTEGLSVMSRLFHEVGRPLDMAFYWPMKWLGGDPIVWAKWFGVAAWLVGAVCIRGVLGRLVRVPPAVAMSVAMLVVTLPVFDLLGELALWMNTGCVMLFWLAWLLFAHLSAEAGWRAILLRPVVLILFFVSFDLNSNLVMFYAVALAVAGLRLPDLQPATLLMRLPPVAMRYGDFLALPIIFWLWKAWFTPTSGFYATGYNEPSLSPDRLMLGYVGLVVNFVFQGLVELFSSASRVFPAIAVGGVTAAITKRFAPTQPDPSLPRGLGVRLVLWGSFLLLAAAFPYIVVGQQLASEGWLSRNCILCPLPVAMIACGLMMMANEWWLPSYPRAWLAGVAAFVTLGVGGCATNYLAYQALGAKHRSVRNGISAAVQESHAVVVQLRDYSHVYPPLIWTFLAHEGVGLPTAFVFETATMMPDVVRPGPDGQPQRHIPQIALDSEALDRAITETTMPYALKGVPRRGPHILVTVQPGFEDAKPPDLGLRYLFLSWFDREKRAEFLQGVTRMSFHLLPPVE